MKRLKKILFSTILVVAFSVSAFAESGFEFILGLPIGMTLDMQQGIYHVIKETSDSERQQASFSPDNFLGFTTGVEAQIGYMFQIKENFGISLLGDIGYRYESVSANYTHHNYDNPKPIFSELYKEGDKLRTDPINATLHSLKIGLFPKFNINAFSIGIGGGIIIPISVGLNSAGIAVGDSYKAEFDKSVSPVGFYAKLSLDYSIFITDTSAINVGLYAAFNLIGLAKLPSHTYPSTSVVENNYEKAFGGLDFGAQIGYRFGPKAF